MSLEQKKPRYLSLQKAAEALGLDPTTVGRYLVALNIERKRFPMDRKHYISMDDIERIRAERQASQEGYRE